MSYVLVTPARNEAAYIEKTLTSVVNQTVLPARWVIVSDGSTDATDAIVSSFAARYPFITLLRREADKERNFGSKVLAFRAGYEQAREAPHDFVGNLDADIELPADYYEQMLFRFARNPRLGLAGGIRFDFCDGAFVLVDCARNSVGGPYQFFRRSCYDAIGGYTPLPRGGIDAVAEIMARQHGWTVRSFPEVKAHHYRCTGTAKGNVFQAAYRSGMKEYVLGYDPFFELFRCAGQARSLRGVGLGVCQAAGYARAAAGRFERPLPTAFVDYLRSEQRARLRHVLTLRADPASREQEASMPS
ncbi:MAG: glycosyltransferase family A protein [Rhodothermales bacterium]|nr:glycosyltransferase family A protein [Rhodothermales bacterium]